MKRKRLWNQFFLLNLREEIDPFKDLHYFRPLNKAYDGDNTFWTIPSPEPNLNDEFWERVKKRFHDEKVKLSILRLARQISEWEPDCSRIVFASILRAGVPITDWLCRLLPGSKAVSISLFVGLGIDRIGLALIRNIYPNQKIVFVDGWTGRGGVARAIAELKAGPIAVLNDPWGWADFAGSHEDILCPSACFTGVATLGFSRTFFINSQELFAAYRFPEPYFRHDVVRAWQKSSPASVEETKTFDLHSGTEIGNEKEKKNFFTDTPLRIHSNEVCRALINADPNTIYFWDEPSYVKENYGLLLDLAELRKKPVVYEAKFLVDLNTRVACSVNKAGKGA